MSEEKQYSKQQLIKSLKVVYELLKYELNENKDSKKYVNEITNKKFYAINDDIHEKNMKDLASYGDYFLAKKIYDYEGLKAIDDYRYDNDRLIIFRNFLLLLFFMRTIYLPEIKKSANTKNILISNLPQKIDEYNTPSKLYEDIFIVDTYGENGLKTGAEIFNENIESEFFDYILTIFTTQAEDIHFNFSRMFDRVLETSSEANQNKNKNIRKFGNAFSKLLTLRNQAVISLFFEMHNKKFGHMDIPQSIIRFLRYYVYNDMEDKSITKSLYVAGVGTSNIVAKFIGDIKGAEDDAFQNEDLTFATDDNNPLSEQIRIIYNRLITEKSSTINIKSNPLFDDKIHTKYDAVISIIPQKLDLFTEREAIEKYPFYPKHQISMYVYYNKVIKHMKHKALIIVPISFISTNTYSTKLFAKDIEFLDSDQLMHRIENGENIDDKKKQIKSAPYQEFLHHYQMGKIIEQRKIKKIMLLPKDIFYHTDEQCVLIELTNEENSGIQFVDITNINQLIERNGNFASINNHPHLKHIYDAYNVPNLFINTNAQLVNEMSGNAILVSKFISYDEIITSSNLLPTYHLKHQQHNADEQRKDITEYFDVIKLQKFTIDSSNVKGENVDVGYFSQSEFSSYGITSNDELTNIVKTKIKKDNKRVDRLYRVYNNDILIYVHYKDRKDMTMVQINNDDICIGMHNLIAIRLKAEYQKQDGYAKALFLWLMSNNGQEALKSITKTNSANRPLISIDDLKMLQVDLSALDDAKASFRKMANEIVKIKKSIKSINELIG